MLILNQSITIISAIRLAMQVQAANHPPADPSYDDLQAAYWTDIEVMGSIVVGSLMTLRPVFEKFIPALRSAQWSRGVSDRTRPLRSYSETTRVSHLDVKASAGTSEHDSSWLALEDTPWQSNEVLHEVPPPVHHKYPVYGIAR